MSSQGFSRFERNYSEGKVLPIFPLLMPDTNGGSGVVLVGDYIANDFVAHHLDIDPDFKKRWVVVSTTQSDTVPTNVTSTDRNLFSNQYGEADYINSKAGEVPYSLELADGLFVDFDLFTPATDKEGQIDYDILYLAKWFPTKKTELLVSLARERPDLRICIFGWSMASERKRRQSEEYRDKIYKDAKDLGNVILFDASGDVDDDNHVNNDGSVVLGPLTKEQVRDRFIRRSRISVFLSETTEAVNRACIESLACDVPLMVALPTQGGMERFMVDGKTSRFTGRDPHSLSKTYDAITHDRDTYSPRETALGFAGRRKSNKKLVELVARVADQSGKDLSSRNWTTYGGDLWTPKSVYDKIV
jgi:glycosyltransferase involved in cell wall biosynthesis